LSSQIYILGIPAGIRDFKYAVRGQIALRAGELEKEIAAGKSNLSEVFYCNIGNPQVFGMKPITFHRQVVSLCANPMLLGDAKNGYAGSQAEKMGYPSDVIERAREFCKVPFGSYSHSKGHKHLRDFVARFFERRDGIPADPEEIFLTDGASAGAKVVLDLLIRDENDGVLIPVPQYPLYSASVTMFGGTLVPYYTNEEKNWSFTKDDLIKARDIFLKEYIFLFLDLVFLFLVFHEHQIGSNGK
jgi:aspartate/methionine/tyrosine aminotransferase